jgi:potassium/chloride transporter 4/5/6
MGRRGGLGTFVGVYTPTVLTILGVILYLRFGWVVGNAGLVRTLGIVILANLITLVTTLSLSAIATNSRVGAGGAYHMVSRSLGLEIGGALGVPLFLSQTFSVTLYAFGLAESVRFAWPEAPVPALAVVIILAVALLALRGADVALRSQLPTLALIGMSLLALTWGALANADPSRLEASVPTEVGFWTIFAVFFPAVTGIMAGVGLSGDLDDPTRSIPRGALGAQLTGFAVYLVVPVLLALAASSEALREDPLIWTRIAPLGAWIVLPGLWGAIFSSAVGSMLGAPRTLQALARDGIAPRRLAGGVGAKQEPVASLFVSVAIALGAVALGDLNAVAVVVTMFFLTIYGTLNLAAALEALSGDPSWRPVMRVHWLLALLGAVACLGVMLLIDPVASVVAVTIVLGLWLLVQRRERRADWGDVRRGIYEALIRWALVRLSARPMTPRSWRPHILVFTEPTEERLDLVQLGSWLSQDRGLVTVCELVIADLIELEEDPLEREGRIQEMLRREKIVAFAEVNVVTSVEQGIIDVAQANGMAGIASNTVMLGWPAKSESLVPLLRVQRRLERLHKSLLIGRLEPSVPPSGRGRGRTIDVWWGGLQRNGDLMLLLAYLLTRNPGWRDAHIRALSVASNELMKTATENQLAQLIPEIRIDAEVNVIVKPAEVSVRDVIHAESGNSDLVLLGLAMPAEGKEAEYAARLGELVAPLRSFLLVKNNSLFIGDLVSPEPASVSPPAPPEVPKPAAEGGG